MMNFDTWWRISGQLDECGKDDWRACWNAAVEAAAMAAEKWRIEDPEWDSQESAQDSTARFIAQDIRALAKES